MRTKIRHIFLNDTIVFAVILLNSLMIFLQESGYNNMVVNTLDALCTIFFIVEMAVKHHEWGWRGYWQNGWNRLDGTLVILSLPSLVTNFVPDLWMNMGFLLALRLLRAFRFFRMLHLFPNFSRIMQNVRLAMRESLSIFVGLFILMVIVALVNYALFNEVAPKYFASPLDSLFSVFQICTVEGWYEIPNTVCADMAPWLTHVVRAYFICILVTLGLIGMSIVNSIFVDAMVSDNNDDLILKLDKMAKDIEEIKRNVNGNENENVDENKKA